MQLQATYPALSCHLPKAGNAMTFRGTTLYLFIRKNSTMGNKFSKVSSPDVPLDFQTDVR